MTLQWIAADLATGRVIADLPSFEPQYPLTRGISTASAGSGVLHLAGAPENWQRAIQEGNATLACYDDTVEADGTHPRPIMWAGYVVSSEPDAFSDDVPVALATWEALLDRAYVGDVTYTTSQHRDDIAADVVHDWFITGMGVGCLLLSYTAGGGPTPPLMDDPPVPNAAIIMQNTDNATVKTRLDQLFAQLGGEYAIDWAWSSDNQFIVPTLRFGTRIGVAAPAGLDPAVTFEDGVLTAFKQGRDYGPGRGANKVVPYSTGQGAVTPYGAAVFGPPDGRPVFEYRYQPAPSISPAGLAKYGQQAIGVLAPGARPITLAMSLARTAGRRFGVNWFMGDDVGYQVGVSRPVLAFPGGVSGVGRVIGVQFSDVQIVPSLADAAIYTESA